MNGRVEHLDGHERGHVGEDVEFRAQGGVLGDAIGPGLSLAAEVLVTQQRKTALGRRLGEGVGTASLRRRVHAHDLVPRRTYTLEHILSERRLTE